MGRPHRSLGRDGMCELTETRTSSHPVLRVVGDTVKDCMQGAVRYPGAKGETISPAVLTTLNRMRREG
jgi:hypothetical protein